MGIVIALVLLDVDVNCLDDLVTASIFLMALEVFDLYCPCTLLCPSSSMGAESGHCITIGTFGFHLDICRDVIDMCEASSYPNVSSISGDSTHGDLVISSKLFRTGFTGKYVV